MSTSAVGLHDIPQSRTVAVPAISWYVWAGLFGVTSASIGAAWDVSWHRSIGRDSFLTPAHIAIYLCGVVAAIVCGYLILSTTFQKSSPLRPNSVAVLGLHAPLGAFLAAWGGVAMLTSAPLDNWWHAAYGLDVKIVSPPHTLLILGIRAVAMGIMLLVLAAMNRAQTTGDESLHLAYRRAFLYLGGLSLIGQMFFLFEFTSDVNLHRVLPYLTMGIAVPVVLAGISRASGYRWAATTVTSIYMLFAIAEILILPLFPATPKLGPVYYQVTHFVPARFPMLLLLPAVALDLLWQRTRSWRLWQIALVTGFLFMALLVAAEWPFARFLLSTASENRFFGTAYHGYLSRPNSDLLLHRFFRPVAGLPLALGLLKASVFASISAWIGLRVGDWMRGVQR
jgi:hypothetical protein